MKRILAFLKPHRYRLVLLGLLYVAITFANLFMPYVMSAIVNNGIANSDMSYIIKMSVIMLMLSVVALVCGIFGAKINSKVGTSFTCSIQKAVFQKVNTLSFEEFSSIGVSSLLTRSTSDVFMLQEACGSFVNVLATVPIYFIGGCALAFTTDWLLALTIVIIAPIVLLIVRLVTRKLGDLWEKSDRYIDIQNKIVRERLSGIRVIRAFDKEEHEHERIANATEVMADNIIKANVRSGFINPVSILLLNLATVAILYIGSVRIQTESTLTAGAIIATIQYVALIMNAVLILSWTILWLPHLRVCIRRVGEVLDLKGVETNSSTGTISNGSLKLENVTFAYGESDVPALVNINMDIKSGDVVAVIGGTGSGKTTVAKLIMDFYAPSSGKIFLGGIPYSELSRETVRDNISIALQKSMIFEGTIGENIRMGKPDATDEELDTVTSIAQINSFIKSNKDGYEHLLTQAGANLSGGQKQRINISRTIIKPASVYIFDDSFSALDYLTESNLRRELNACLKGKTQIIITQRAATAMRCDKVYVMDRGCIVGEGTHEELLKTCTIYKEIYDSQLGGMQK